MDGSQKRRIVKRRVMALAVVASLPVWYFTSCAAINWQVEGEQNAGAKAIVSKSSLADAYCAPMNRYCRREFPGHRELSILFGLSYEHGSGTPVTWAEMASAYDSSRRQAALRLLDGSHSDVGKRRSTQMQRHINAQMAGTNSVE